MSDFSKILKAYGYRNKSDQQDFIRLIYLAGGFEPDKLTMDLRISEHTWTEIGYIKEIVKEAINTYHEPKNLQNFDPKVILNHLLYNGYPLEKESRWPQKLHNWLLHVTQREFFARVPGEERWQQKIAQWMKDYKTEIREIIERLKLTDEVSPQLKFYEAICILGSTVPEIKNRIEYTAKILEEHHVRTPLIYLLTGERFADAKADSSDYLKKVHKAYDIAEETIIETHFMQFIMEEIKEAHETLRKIPYLIIHTPKKEKTRRPTTIDTVVQLSKMVHDVKGDILFISNAPHIIPQREDIVATAKKYLPKIKPEVVGDKCEKIVINQILGAVGGTLFGGYARVASELGYQEKNKDVSFI